MAVLTIRQTCRLLVFWPTSGLRLQGVGCEQCVSVMVFFLLTFLLCYHELRPLMFLPFIDIFNEPLCTCSPANDKSSKRVFLLGPSHHLYLEKAALTKCTHYGTPLGNLPIDAATTAELHKTGQFDWMTQDVDEDEHSLEMHLPYIYKMLSK
jgi:hypothetical protein